MRITLELTDEEVTALDVMARGRQIRIVAGTSKGSPEDRAIARILIAAEEAKRAEGLAP